MKKTGWLLKKTKLSAVSGQQSENTRPKVTKKAPGRFSGSLFFYMKACARPLKLAEWFLYRW